MMNDNDFIRRGDALKAFDNNIIDGATLLARWAIEKVHPIDAVLVVRCKDCKHYSYSFCSHLDHEYESHYQDYYCADGERREVE